MVTKKRSRQERVGLDPRTSSCLLPHANLCSRVSIPHNMEIIVVV